MTGLGSTYASMFLVALAIVLPTPAAAEQMSWDLSEDYRAGSRRENPNGDRYGEPTWHFLRTTGRTSELPDRQWLRDGKYVPLEYHGASLFDLPLDAWVKQPSGEYRNPVIGRFSLRHELDLRFESGDVFFVPGYDDACVLGWRSPVSGILEIEGSFHHAQRNPDENQGVHWYVERGPAPDPGKGFASISLASGASRFGTDSQVGSFQITDQAVEPGDFVYFIVDAKADGTEQPHQGDMTRLRARITVHQALRPPPPHFERDVQPILDSHCHGCHGADLQESGLDLRTVTSMLGGGDSGPSIVRGEPNRSYLMQLIQRGEMPPAGEERLTADEVSVLARWIRLGTPSDERIVEPPPRMLVGVEDRKHWAFRKLAQAELPRPQVGEHVRTPIDVFVLSRLQQAGLGYSPEADRVTLIRRTFLDLVGLPPTPEQVDDFLADTAPGAFGRLIDRLLDSPHFGERWGRHWLDVVGYADTVGFDQDARLIVQTDGKWRYRDYVIDAFNNDKPYNRFIAEQLAGDERVDWRGAARYTAEIRENLIATGFLRTARDQTHEPESNIPLCYFDVLHDTVQIVSNSLLGLTVQCARCHNHKFDPIPQEDYYRLMAAFTPAYNPDLWKPVFPYKPHIEDRALVDVSESKKAEIEQLNDRLDQRIAELRPRIDTLRDATRRRLYEQKLAGLPEPIRDDVKAADETTEVERNEVQKYLVEKFGAALEISDENVAAGLNDADRVTISSVEEQIAELNGQRQSWGKIQALFDVGPPPPTFLLKRGQYQTPGPEVDPGFLRVLCESDEAALAEIQPTATGTSGRRTALARWLTDSETPAGALVARVMVNRVWQHLLGEGLVLSPENFGTGGEPPTHPELLEWLSRRFVDDGWRIKPLVKLIMLSGVYRQTSQIRGGDAGVSIDPENKLLWRMRLRRLEAEVVRDSILAVSGKLDATVGGPPVLVTARSDGKVVVDESKLPTATAKWRRSVYLLVRRAYNLSMLSVFDQPLISTSCMRRETSAVPLQSLTMLNDEFVAEHAGFFALRLQEHVGEDTERRIATAFRIALARPPSNDEAARCIAFLARQVELYRSNGVSGEAATHQALTELCHTLLNTSEFIYAE